MSEVFPPTCGICLTEVMVEDQSVQVQLTAIAPTALCPDCATPSSAVHSHYQRRLADLPWGSLAVRIQLLVRKFVCRHVTCARRIFTERLPDTSPLRMPAKPCGWSTPCRPSASLSAGRRAPGSRPACGCRPVRPPSSGGCGRPRYRPCQASRRWAWTSGPGGEAIAMAPSWLIWRRIGSSTSCRTGRPRRSRPGWLSIPRSPRSVGTGVLCMRRAFARAHLTPCRSSIAFIWWKTSAKPSKLS
jgi:hypothetical protein